VTNHKQMRQGDFQDYVHWCYLCCPSLEEKSQITK